MSAHRLLVRKLEAQIGQLQAENQWLRKANKDLSEALKKVRDQLSVEVRV